MVFNILTKWVLGKFFSPSMPSANAEQNRYAAPTDLVAQDLRDCLSVLADIIGDAITIEAHRRNAPHHLFKVLPRFCIGK